VHREKKTTLHWCSQKLGGAVAKGKKGVTSCGLTRGGDNPVSVGGGKRPRTRTPRGLENVELGTSKEGKEGTLPPPGGGFLPGTDGQSWTERRQTVWRER